MTLDTKSEQLLTAASDILDSAETELLMKEEKGIADRVRQAHYLIYLVLKPETRLIREPIIPVPDPPETMPPAPSKKKRK